MKEDKALLEKALDEAKAKYKAKKEDYVKALGALSEGVVPARLWGRPSRIMRRHSKRQKTKTVSELKEWKANLKRFKRRKGGAEAEMMINE